MLAHEHYREGEKLLVEARTATDPTRLIGLAQGHFLAAQTMMMAENDAHKQNRAPVADFWLANGRQQYDPAGKPVRG
jgi:hypothetical protein